MTQPHGDGSQSNMHDEEESIEGYEPPEPGGWEGYPLDELAIRDERRAAVDVVRRIDLDRFVMDPDFQRGFVWDTTKQSRLIESILLRIPLPTFYVAEDKTGRLIVVANFRHPSRAAPRMTPIMAAEWRTAAGVAWGAAIGDASRRCDRFTRGR